MSEAKNLLEGQQLEEPAGANAQVVVLFPALRRRERPPPLSDEEIDQVRSLIAAFNKISTTCPIARKILESDQR